MSQDVKRILLLMDNRADSNWGSRATTNMLVGLLKERFPKSEIMGVPRSITRPRARIVRRFVESAGPHCLLTENYSGAVQRKTIRLLTESWIDLLSGADLLVLNGEGTLHPQNQTRRWLPVIHYAKTQLKKKLWIVNSSFGFSHRPEQSQFLKVLGVADHIAVREPISHRELSGHGVRAVRAADCAFLTNPLSSSEIDPVLERLTGKKPFAVFTGGATAGKWPIDSQRKMIEKLRSHGLAVVYASSTPTDERIYEQLNEEMPIISHRDVDYAGIAAIQAEATILVGGRFHPTILASSVGTPFVAVTSNTHKMEGLMEMLGTERYLFGLGDESGASLAIDEVLRCRDQLSLQLLERSALCAEQARLNLPAA